MKTFLLVAFYTATGLTAQTLIPQGERRVILDTLANLKSSFERCAANQDLRESARECIESIEYFQKHAIPWEPRRAGDGQGIRISFQQMLRVVQNLPPAPADAARTMRNLADDLSDKRSVCWRAGLDAQPEVEVRPKKNGTTEARGLEVWYIEKFLASDPTAQPHRFPGFSSPVTDELVPGRYLFWAQDPNDKRSSGQKTEQRVAAKGNRLSVPIRIEIMRREFAAALAGGWHLARVDCGIGVGDSK